jgi:hypothetical protein
MKSYRNALILLVVIAAFMILLFLINLGGRSGQYEKMVPYDKNDKIEDINADINQEHANYMVLDAKDVCEGCHMSGKPSVPQALTVPPHQNGGAYCLSCHEINHEKHPMSNGVTCDSCHTGPAKPVYFNGSISCNNCHNYPDSLSPSEGNIITIHRPRGVSCNKCHTDDCRNCHAESRNGAKWNKRLDHFKVVTMGRSI